MKCRSGLPRVGESGSGKTMLSLQRVMIAMALAAGPKLPIADELRILALLTISL